VAEEAIDHELEEESEAPELDAELGARREAALARWRRSTKR
jgi:hypothetical protein